MKESENIEQTEIRQMLLASAFKLYYSDIGIMSARLGMTLEALQGKETEHFRGILTVPVECKAGNHVKAKSMMVYMEKYAPAYAIRISARNFGLVNGIKSVSLYSVFCI